MNKTGALELSIGTIVIIVIAVTMLILGIVFVRSIMCSGILISEDLSSGVRNEIKTLFGADKFGVKCMGEGSQEVGLGSGGRRKIVCMIKTEEVATYKLTADVDTVKGASKSTVQGWIVDQDWTGSVTPGTDEEAAVVLLDIPRDAPTTTLKIIVNSMKGSAGGGFEPDTKRTHTSYIDIVPVGYFKTTLC